MHARMQVKEAIMTSALLRLPQALPYSRKAERVEQILTELVRARSGPPMTQSNLAAKRATCGVTTHISCMAGRHQ